MEGAVVVNFANKVDGVGRGIGRNVDDGNRLVSMVDNNFRRTYFRLLPPSEREAVAVSVR